MKARLLAMALVCIALAVLGAVLTAIGFATDAPRLMDMGGALTVPATIVMGLAVVVVLIGSPAVAWRALRRRRRD